MIKINSILTIGLSLWLYTSFVSRAISDSPRQIAKQIYPLTVKITGNKDFYTGVLVNKQGEIYSALSCGNFYSSNPSDYQVILDNNQVYNVQSLRNVNSNNPLILLTFTSQKVYPTAKLGNSQSLSIGDRLYLAGFVKGDEQAGNQNNSISGFQFTEGIISSMPNPPRQNVYNFTHTNISYAGLEGSPLFDSEGKLVGLNCGNQPLLDQRNNPFKLSFGIGINAFQNNTSTPTVNSKFSAFGSPPPYPKNRFLTSPQIAELVTDDNYSQEHSQKLLDLTNIARKKAGLSPLRLSINLSQAAQNHALDMASQNLISHQGSDHSNPSDRAKNFGYLSDYIGENITGGRITAQETIDGWLKNPLYRANLLNTKYTEVGFGYVYQPNSKYQHYWVALFGTKISNNSGTTSINSSSLNSINCQGQQWLTQATCIGDDLNSEEAKLYHLINQYRIQRQLSPIAQSVSLNQVANRHVRDLQENLALYNQNGKDWRFGWSNCPYNSEQSVTFSCLWSAPQRLKTTYSAIAYEIICGGDGEITAEEALRCWQNNSLNNDLIINQGLWQNYQWRAMGIGIYNGYAVLWLGEKIDGGKTAPKPSPQYFPLPGRGKIW